MIARNVKKSAFVINANVIAHGEIGHGGAEMHAKIADRELQMMQMRRAGLGACPLCRLLGIRLWIRVSSVKGRRFLRQHIRDHHSVREQMGADVEASWIGSIIRGHREKLGRARKLVDHKKTGAKMKKRVESKKTLNQLMERFGMEGTP